MKEKRVKKELRTTNCEPRTSLGFTLIEMMVTIGIIALFSVIVLVKHASFGEQIAINNLAHEVGLVVRQAQVYGVSVIGGESSFEHAYGVHFDMSNPAQFVLFIDIDDGGDYDSEGSELVEAYSMNRGNAITDICVNPPPGGNCDIEELDVTFLRPDPDAMIRTFPPVSADTATVKISSPNGLQKEISVNLTGHISVE